MVEKLSSNNEQTPITTAPKNAITKESDKPAPPRQDWELDRIIQMAWEDRTPFEAIEFQFGLKEKEVIEFMRKHSKPSSFRMWRKRMNSRKTKHLSLRETSVQRFKCSQQKASGNKIAKR